MALFTPGLKSGVSEWIDHKGSIKSLFGEYHPLSQSPTYEFSSAEGDDPDRFMLLFSPVGVEEKNPDPIFVFSDNSNILVEVPENISRGTIEFFDIHSRFLLMGHLMPGGNRLITSERELWW